MKFSELSDSIVSQTKEKPAWNAFLVGISGIDGAGKGFLASRIVKRLIDAGRRVALINADAWLNLPRVRFSADDPGRHFYRNALRLDEMFENLVLPLKRNRSIHLKMDFANETANKFRPYTYNFTDIDIILLEGIFLFKRAFVQHLDLKIWIESSFEKALLRAIDRGQEDLSKEETVEAYENIYFPAQRIHFETDDPKRSADIIFKNE